MFFYSLYVYQSLSLHNVETGFFDLERASKIALVSQIGLTIAHFASPRNRVFNEIMFRKRWVKAQIFRRCGTFFSTMGIAGVLGTAGGLFSGPWSYILILFLYVGLAVRVSERAEGIIKDYLLWVSLGLMLSLSVINNSRTDLFGFVLMALFLLVLLRRKVITVKLVAAFVVFLPILSLYSEVTTSIRYARELDINIASVFFDNILDADVWGKKFNPFYQDSGTIEKINYSDFFSPVYGEGHPGLFARLTLLPILDITSSRLPEFPAFTDWGTFWKIVLSALPSFGQEKELIYADKVVWSLGLRTNGEVGYPLITVQGELFSLGGYPVVLFASFMLYWILNFMYRTLVKVTVSRVVAIVVMSQLIISSCFSPTLLSLTSASIRTPLLLIAAVILLIPIVSTCKVWSVRGFGHLRS
ncbi:hypothetical protein [Paracoccus benzoatiresistens]|uniref:Oligosaccharide repeat unit polymerase n=1 Tax=Paracoccus benzoatiresistens TaxID=2997341 RepID=A0ABT4J9V0_9RHOB|nr:hypothetical protein [Paracoccus sp. EF6]MCZ0963684.1 hypothetical protein [Paracoccus sp. EF6]